MTHEPPASVERDLIERLLHVAAPSEQAFPVIFREARAYLALSTPPARPGREALPPPKNLEMKTKIAWIIRNFVIASTEEEQALPAATFLVNRDDILASQILALFEGAGA